MVIDAAEVRPRLDPSDGIARTEIEVAADVLAVLIERKAIRGDEAALRALGQITGVPSYAIKAAIDHQRRWTYRRPRVHGCVRDAGSMEQNNSNPESDRKHAANQGTPKYKAKNPGPDLRVCSDCGPAPLPLSRFSVKALNKDLTPVYHYRCDGCRRKYQQRRYLSVKAERTLGALVQFVLDHDDGLTDLGCPYCADPIEVGQDVAGLTRLAHAACLAVAVAVDG